MNMNKDLQNGKRISRKTGMMRRLFPTDSSTRRKRHYNRRQVGHFARMRGWFILALPKLLNRWPRFAEYKSQMNDLWPHRRMKAGPSALPTGIVDAVTIARRLARATGPLDWPALSRVASPPLGRMTVYRHLHLLKEAFGVQIERVHGQGWIVTEWGLFDSARLCAVTPPASEDA